MKRIATLLFMIALFNLKPITSKCQTVKVSDSLVLVDLYNSTNGANWINHKNWLTGPVKSWYGVTLGDVGEVEAISLSQNNLTGNLPASIGNLVNLGQLILPGNNFTGTAIPVSIGNLKALITLNLSSNNLSGSIPASIGNITTLQKLYLGQNNLSGNIPAELGNCINLQVLRLYVNHLSGNIPAELGKLTSLQDLSVSTNALMGSIPTSLGNLIKLTSLDLSHNQLKGQLPASLGNLKLLQYFDANSNQFSGSIPASFGNMANLSSLTLSYNYLTGGLPQGLGKALKLQHIYLNNNHLSGSIDSSIFNPAKGNVYINLDHNYYTFTILEGLYRQDGQNASYSDQDTILPVHNTGGKLSVSAGGTLSSNTYEWFIGGASVAVRHGDSTFIPGKSGSYSVKATGILTPAGGLTLNSTTIKVDVVPVPNADSLALADIYKKLNGPKWIKNTNWLKGPIATWYGVSVNKDGRVTALRLGNNKLTGSLPESIGKLDSLDVLDLNENNLSGPVPGLVTTLKHSLKVSLQNNYFDFDALEVIAGYFKSAMYGPQHTVIPLQAEYKHNGYTNLIAVAGGYLYNNTYTWHKDTQVVRVDNGFNIYQTNVVSKYYVTVTNSVVKGVTLYSNIAETKSVNDIDSLALVDLYNSTNGPNWFNHSNWLTKEPIKNWAGITLTYNGLVETIKLVNNNLDGKIPASIGNLSSVYVIQLDSNKLTGNIPPQFDDLQFLTGLTLSHNKFTGILPGITGAGGILSFDLSYNNLSGTIDGQLSGSYWMKYLNLSHNHFTGTIPDIFTFQQTNYFTGFTVVNLSYNQFEGALPAAIITAGRLELLDVSHNKLTGNIPAFKSYRLSSLNLSYNQLSGPVPALNGNPKLTAINISNNSFTFDGMEEIAQQYNFAVYWPQRAIHLGYNKNKKHFYVHAGGDFKNNIYKWYNNNILVSTKTGDSTFTSTVKGRYFATINNKLAQKLKLYTDTLGITDSLTLPVELISFTGQMVHGTSLLNWQTATEINTAYFNVERSLDGIYFTTVGTVNAAGNSTVVKGYNFSDTYTGPENSIYYRLQEVDKDGKKWASKIVKLSVNAAATAPVIWPNPVTNVLTLKWEGAPAQVTCIISNAEGKQVLMRKQTANTQQLQLNTRQLSAGTYILTVLTTDGQKHSLKFVKQ